MKRLFYFISLALLLTACENPILDSEDGSADSNVGEANVILHLTQFENIPFTRGATDIPFTRGATDIPFTRGATDITELCTRLNIALFDADGTKVKTVAQKEADDNFGTVALTLDAGTYRLVIIAHSGEGSATITSEEKVTFANNKVTDTFYYCGDLVVNDSRQSYDLTLRRAVAMFRLVLDDNELPAGFAKMKFYYLGGSSTFSPRDGYGCVNSKQTEVRTVTAGTKTFDIYTMPHAEDDVLTKVTITALDANDNALKERTLENIPITRNKITSYKGSFFGSSGSLSDGTFRLTADAEWSDVNEYTF